MMVQLALFVAFGIFVLADGITVFLLLNERSIKTGDPPAEWPSSPRPRDVWSFYRSQYRALFEPTDDPRVRQLRRRVWVLTALALGFLIAQLLLR